MNNLCCSPSTLSHIYRKLRQTPFHRCFYGLVILCIVLTIYTNAIKLEKPANKCKKLSPFNSSTFHLRENSGPPYLTYIISNKLQRFNTTVTNLQTILPDFFDIRLRPAVSLNDSRIYRQGDPRASSLLLTFIDLWSEFGARSVVDYSDNDWMFIFEDDVNLVPYDIIRKFYPNIYAKWNYTNPNTSIAGNVEQGLELAKKDGILYLGTCGAQFRDNNTVDFYSYDRLFEFRRGAYFCTHAIAYTKWRARRIWGDYAAYRFIHNEVGSDTIARQWMILSKTFPLSVAANIHWPPGTGHYGFFYQDRGAIPSTRVT